MQTEVLFHALSDVTRRQILSLLIMQGECCVCTLYETLNQPQPKVSRHLAVLRDADLVQTRREGLWVHYSLNPELPGWARTVLTCMAQGEEAAVSGLGKRHCALPSKPIPRRRTHV
jgi:ArsR family transcriptional regulator